ncbi:MAG: calcium/sodium antiporter, partial [Nitrosopumilus sp.]
MDVAISAILTVIGLIMLCFGGNWLVNGGVAIAQKFRISNLIIGMTIVAYGTS